jgi:hypothetical protein
MESFVVVGAGRRELLLGVYRDIVRQCGSSDRFGTACVLQHVQVCVCVVILLHVHYYYYYFERIVASSGGGL